MIDMLAEVSGRSVSRETLERLNRYAEILVEENDRQNLVAKSTLDALWDRHLIDGAQLLRFVMPGQNWVDVGSGPGLPGMVVATFGEPITLVEPRRLRVEFLERVKAELSLDNVRIVLGKAEQVAGTFDIITARAVAALPSLLAMTTHLAHYGTKWVLPKGQKAKSELDEARRSWQGRFELMPSLTSPDASIVIAEGVQPRGKR